MKVVFVGPSLPDAVSFSESSIDVRAPAIQGDVLEAVKDGATVIGIVDGGFEYTAPIWHKEILYALSRGVRVYGAASMGALRAVECQAFGMVGVGRIFDEYASGTTVDDADVALLHGPAELNYKPLTLPLVNVRATLDHLEKEQSLSGVLCRELRAAAGRLFFKERTWRSVIANCDTTNIPNPKELLGLLVAQTVDQKRADAMALIEAVRAAPDDYAAHAISWKMHNTFLFRTSSDTP